MCQVRGRQVPDHPASKLCTSLKACESPALLLSFASS